jgi:hypothetical protein
MQNTGVLMKITWDAYAASHRAVREMQEELAHLAFEICTIHDPRIAGFQRRANHNSEPQAATHTAAPDA